MATAKTASPEPLPWVSLPEELYEQTATALVTFSHKTINSNIPAGGIRLSPAQGLKLPYVSARTLLGAGQALPLDYVANSGKTATAVKQLHQVDENRSSAPAEESRLLQEILLKASKVGREIGTQAVSIRARQLLLPKGDGHYVAVTPLSAGGVSRIIRKLSREHEELRREHPDGDQSGLQRIPVAVFGLGGAKSQNVGALAKSMQRPLVFFAPHEDREIKAALALHFQGAPIRLPRVLLRGFRDWSQACRSRNEGKIPTDMHTRDEEIEHVRQMVQAVLDQGEEARQRLLAHLDVLPSGGVPLISAEANPVARGLVDPDLRDKDWPRAFAEVLARHIADHRFGDDRGEFQFDQDDRNALQRMIEEVVR